MRELYFLATSLFLSLFLFQSLTYADNRKAAMSLTVGGGYVDFGAKRHLDNSGFPFIALGYQLREQFGIEALFATTTTEARRGEDSGRSVRSRYLLVDGLYYFKPYGMIAPFVIAGIGDTTINPNGTDANDVGNINAGIGVQLFFNREVALRLDARDVITTSGGNHDLLAMAGITFLLDIC